MSFICFSVKKKTALDVLVVSYCLINFSSVLSWAVLTMCIMSESTVCSSIRQSIPTAFAVTVQYLQLFNQWLGLELVFFAVKCWLPVIQLYVNWGKYLEKWHHLRLYFNVHSRTLLYNITPYRSWDSCKTWFSTGCYLSLYLLSSKLLFYLS